MTALSGEGALDNVSEWGGEIKGKAEGGAEKDAQAPSHPIRTRL